jgi:hypothetical protein
MPASTARARASGAATAPRRASTGRRTARARRPAPARRAPRPRARGRTPARGLAAPAHVIPAAVGRTAVAVGDLADSGLVVRMTRSRTWIVVLGVLLAGIVALNVLSLSFTAQGGKVATRADALQQQNAQLRSQLTERLSSNRVKDVAAGLGLSVPEAQEISYLRAGDEYAAMAAKRIEEGALVGPSSASPLTPATATVVPAAATEPQVPVTPESAAPVPTAPEAPVPTESVPAP